MNSNFERLRKIINRAHAKNFSCLFHVEPRNLPRCPKHVGQDFGRFWKNWRRKKNGFWYFPTFTINSESTDDPKCGQLNQKRIDLEKDVILNQISNKRDVSAKWISGKNPLKMLFCFKNCCDSCLVLLWVQNDFGPSKSFWSSTNHLGRVQIVLLGSKAIWSGSN